MKKLQWNFSQKFNFFIHKNAQIGRKNIYLSFVAQKCQ